MLGMAHRGRWAWPIVVVAYTQRRAMHRAPHSTHVLGGTHVSVIAHATRRVGAGPLAYVRGHCRIERSTGVAALRTRIPAVDRDWRAPRPARFGFQVPNQLAATYIAHGPGQRVLAGPGLT